MAGTKEGGQKTMATLKSKYGKDYYARIGQIGGSKKVPKGFAVMPRDKVSKAGRKGGAKSRRKTMEEAITDFQQGFNQPTLREKLFTKLKG